MGRLGSLLDLSGWKPELQVNGHLRAADWSGLFETGNRLRASYMIALLLKCYPRKIYD
jgi:hypothetical protein